MTDCETNRKELERLFQRGLLSRAQFMQALAAAGVTASGLELLMGSTAQPAVAQSEVAARYLVLIVLDAFRPDYMQLAAMPNLDALIRSGTTYDRAWVGQLESETPVGHATLSTGAMPKHEGVIGFEWRDPKTGREVLDGWPPDVLAGDLDRDLLASGASSIPRAVKAANPAAKVVALSSEKVYAADAMGAASADYVLYHQRVGSNPTTLTPRGVPGHVPPQHFFDHPLLREQLPLRNFTDWDWLSTMLALASVESFHPEVLMVNLPGADVYGHPYGGPATPAVMSPVVAGLDRNIGRILDAYKRAGIYSQTLFIVTADHGMVPNDRAVPGILTKAAVRQAGGQYFFHTGGTAADIYLRNYWHARAVSREMLRVPGVEAAYYRIQPHGHAEYLPAPGLAIDPTLDAAYQYLLSTFVGPTSPDVVVPFRENTIGEVSATAHGDHGGLNWGAQHIPLILSGPGVSSGALSHFPARLMDVAPTALRLMDVPVPAMDGIVLADALDIPFAGDVAGQVRLAPALTVYLDALVTQSTKNLAEDQSLGLRPPPSAPARP
jgi:Type I phosphodiesterase / nucleotide pyrophosphatase